MIDGVEVSVTTSKIISDDEKKDEEMRFLRYVDDFVCLQDTVSIKTIGARLVLCVCVCVCQRVCFTPSSHCFSWRNGLFSVSAYRVESAL